MRKVNINALKAYMVVDDNTKQIDYKRSCERLIADLKDYENKQETSEARIASALAAVFDKFKGAQINKDALISFTMQELGASPETYGALSKGLTDYLKSNTGSRGSLFGVRLGPGGGFFRWIDRPETEEDPKDTIDKK